MIQQFDFSPTEYHLKDVYNTIKDNKMFTDVLKFVNYTATDTEETLTLGVSETKKAVEIVNYDLQRPKIKTANYYNKDGKSFFSQSNSGSLSATGTIHISRIVSTKYGLIFFFKTTNNSAKSNLILTVNQNNELVLKVTGNATGLAYSSTQDSWGCYSFNNSTSWQADAHSLPGIVKQATSTVITPILCCNSTDYTAHCFIAVYNQFNTIVCNVSMNGKQYATDGYFYLED